MKKHQFSYAVLLSTAQAVSTRFQGEEQPLISIRLVIVNPLPGTESIRNAAVFQFKRNQKYRSFWLLVGNVQCQLDLLVDITCFVHRTVRETYNHYVCCSQGFMNF